MKNSGKALFTLASIFGLMLLGAWWLAAQQRPPDLVLHNGKVLTVDANFSTAQALAITGDRITAVGANADVLRLAGTGTTVIDLKGKTVIPGLIDTHVHTHEYAVEAYSGDLSPQKLRRYPVDWRGVVSKDDVLNQVQSIMERYKFPPGEWVYLENQLGFVSGGSVEHAKILYDQMNRWEFSKVTPNNPAVMSLGIPDFNGFLVNDTGMEIILREYGDYLRKYGRYWVDSQGRPTGHVEPPASRLAFLYLPQPDPADLAPVYQKYHQEWNAAGVTSISTRLPKSTLEAYKLLESKGELTMRVGYGQEWFFGTIPDPASGMKNLKGLVGTGDSWLWTTSVAPTEVDGATTRACTDQKRGTAFGTIDSWWPTGQCQTDAEFRGAAGKAASISGHYFRDWVMASGQEGVRFANTHVAGDRSVHNILGWAQEIQRRNGRAATQGWMLDHCFLVNPADLPLAARLGVGFSCAPKYLERSAEVARSYGDPVANNYMVPVKTMLDKGVKVYFESDRDTYVWKDLEILLTRKDSRGRVWGAHEAVDRPTALRMITRWAADYVLKPNLIGSIERGKLADVVVLDRDYLTIPVEEVSELRPQLTLLNGKIIYLHPAFSQEHNLRPQGAVISTYEDLVKRRTSERRLDF
jgi:predicted amidohydrolase YtcJ